MKKLKKKYRKRKKDGTIQKRIVQGSYKKTNTGGICGKMISELLLLIRKDDAELKIYRNDRFLMSITI